MHDEMLKYESTNTIQPSRVEEALSRSQRTQVHGTGPANDSPAPPAAQKKGLQSAPTLYVPCRN